jgi:major membrane immunogen (membrane-anchored lipoprotein)
MRKTLTAILTALFLTVLASSTAVAQDHTRNWDNGHVVAVSEVHIKDGMFNAYINDLNNVWRKFLEEQMKDGSVVGYNMYGNPAARDGEPDLYLTVTYANWAAFDLGEEY